MNALEIAAIENRSGGVFLLWSSINRRAMKKQLRVATAMKLV